MEKKNCSFNNCLAGVQSLLSISLEKCTLHLLEEPRRDHFLFIPQPISNAHNLLGHIL